jgi:hypothetical protein
MSNELQKSPQQRAKEFLQIEDEHSIFELIELLRQFRNETHPDRFQDQELKSKAESRFKSAQTLLDELEKQVEVEHFNRKPAELALYKPLYDAVQLQNELDKTREALEETRNELRNERGLSDTLRKELQTKTDDSLRAEIEHLQSLYKPSTRKYASIGLGIILSGALGAMTQMEKVSGILAKYSPFGKQYISTGLFICLLFFLVVMVRKLWEREYIKRKSEEVCSPKYANDFIEYLNAKRSSDTAVVEFSEIEVFDFTLGGRQWYKKLAGSLGIQIFGPETINRLKDIFIHNSLNKKLVSVSRAEMMQRFFTVQSSKSDLYWYHKYTEERDKNRAT